jgi:hypothetical protein
MLLLPGRCSPIQAEAQAAVILSYNKYGNAIDANCVCLLPNNYVHSLARWW